MHAAEIKRNVSEPVAPAWISAVPDKRNRAGT